MIKLGAFDWNGTLLADTKLAAAADRHALKEFSIGKISRAVMQRHFTVPIINYLTSLGLSKKDFRLHHQEINKTFNHYYEARVSRCRTRGGVRASLKFLKTKNIQSIIYSNHVKSYIIRQLARLNIEKYFAMVLAREDHDISHMHNRGKEQKLRDYIKANKLRPHEIISVGDTEEEIEIGKAQGYRTVAITGGYNTAARLKKHKPDFLIHNMLELKKIIKKLNIPSLPSPRVGRD